MMKKLRRVLLLAALIVLGTCNVSAATKTQVKVLSGTEYIESLNQMQTLDDKDAIDAVASGRSVDNCYVTNRLLVLSEKKIDSFGFNGIVSAISNGRKTYIIQFDSKENADKAYASLSRDSSVEVEYDVYEERIDSVELEQIANSTPTDDYGMDTASATTHYSWGVAKMGGDSYIAYVNQTKHSDIVVAVVDSGINKSHTMFTNRIVSGYDFVNGDKDPADDNGHGTHVAGTIVDVTADLKCVKIMPLKVFDSTGSGATSDIATAIEYAADKGAKVLNYSGGGGHSSIKDEAVDYACSKGVTVCVAAGNENINIDSYGRCPAHCTNAITVAAIDDSNARASFSNYGDSVDVAAPGVSVKSAWIGSSKAMNTISGTSMATPHVTAACAILRTQYGSLSSAQMHQLLQRISRNIGSDYYYGYGLIRFSNLMKDVSGFKTKISATTLTYTGAALTPNAVMYENNIKLYKDVDYTLKYANNKNVGTATVSLIGKGSYTGKAVIKFNIVPKGTSITDIAVREGALVVKWKKQTVETTGYQVFISDKSDFSTKKVYYVKGNTNYYKKITGLTSGKKYYVKVRTYKEINGTRYFSSTSAVKTGIAG